MKIGILGYGNIGRGVEFAITQNPDMELVAVFTRRNPESLKINSDAKVINIAEIEQWRDKIDVLIICSGSATDLPEQTPKFAKIFNVVDSFDNHAMIPPHFDNVDKSAKEGSHVAMISGGWDPGLFSLNRLYADAILPVGKTYTFWGKGISQGHSDAIRRIEGVKNAKQYTIPVDEALDRVRSGEQPTFVARDMHLRECFVVAEDGADKERIEREIKTMPNYFEPYNTIVHFISEEELNEKHQGIPHGGFVIRSGKTAGNQNHVIEYSLKLDSNPEFTSSVLVAYARAVYRLYKEGQTGCKTVFDIAPKYLSIKSDEELRKTML